MYLRPTALSALRPSARQQLSLLISLIALFALATIPPSLARLLPLSPTGIFAQPDLGKLPLSFEPNVGQAASTARFMAHAPGGMLYFAPSEVVLSLQGSDKAQSIAARMRFIDANPGAKITGGVLLPGTANYYIGSDPARWRTNVPTFSGVTYSDLYNGVTLSYEGGGGRLKGTYTLAPNADPSQIRWAYNGAGKISPNPDGSLAIAFGSATVTEGAPVAWQEINGARVPVSAKYLIGTDSSLTFTLGTYDRASALFIDPTLTYSTFFGGSYSESVGGIGIDATGNIYLGGETSSYDFPTMNPIQPNLRGANDLFITKLTPDGSALLYSTYLGGGAEDNIGGLAVDPFGNAYVAGVTQSTNFPTLNAIQPANAGYYDAVVAKLNTSGGLIYSTYLGGGSGLNGDDEAHGIAADAAGNAYVTGETASSDFPVANAFQPTWGGSYDGFVAEINPTGSALVYSTYLGGNSFDAGMAVAVDSAGSAYVTGRTDSTNFPLHNPIQPNPGPGQFDSDAFVTKFSPTGSALAYSTYLGGSDNEPWYHAGIAVDAAGNAYATGTTSSPDFPLANAYQSLLLGGEDAYLTKINPAGTAFVYSTYFGGTGWDSAYRVAADATGNAYITGNTSSVDLPVVEPVQPTYGGGYDDAFVTVFPPDGAGPLYSTYLGGSGGDEGYAIYADGAGNTYVGGFTASANFPTTANAFQPTIHGVTDGFFSKLFYAAAPTPTGTPPTATPRPPTRTDTATVTNTPNPCGLNWNIVPSPSNASFQDISALSATDIWAVGYVSGSNPSQTSLILHWNGSQWSLSNHPNPGSFDNALYAVEAISANDVWAVGTYGDNGTVTRFLALHWDGQSWTQFPMPIIPQGQGYTNFHNLESLSAVSFDDVWAVGYATSNNAHVAVAVHWDGTQWSLTNVPPVPNEDVLLQGVAAISSDDVWAVGSYGSYGYYNTYRTFTMHWDGAAWSIVPSPNPGGIGVVDTLYDVAASSSTDVWVVGAFGYPEQTLAMRWDGTQWNVVPSPNVGNGDNDLSGTTIISPNDIWAVGTSLVDIYQGTIRTLTEHWNGTQWSVVSSASPGEIYNDLEAAAAVSSGDVWAVGYAQTLSSDGLTLRYSDACLTPTPLPTGTPPTTTPRPPTNTRTPTHTPTNTPSATPTVCGLSYPIAENFEAGNLGSFVSGVPTCVPGGCGWVSSTDRAHSGTRSVHAPDVANISDQLLTTASPILMPSVIVSSTLTFWHSYTFDQGFDGGVLETSIDGGISWQDAAPNITQGGYTGLLSSLFGNPIGGRNAWTGSSGADFVRVTVNLAPYAGHSLLFRFREGTDNSVGHLGWWVDDVQVTIVTSCGGGGGTPTPPVATNTPVAETSTPPSATDTPIAATSTPTPTATVAAPQACNVSFSDVPQGSTFYAQIVCLACSGYVSGYADGTFRPNSLLTRGQLAKIVVNVSLMPHNPTAQMFEDTPPGSTFYPYVEAMADAGYISGYDCGGPGEPCDQGNRPYFRPNATATRGQLTKIVATAGHMMGGNPTTGQMFADVTPASPFYGYVQTLATRNFMQGYSCGGPGEPCNPQGQPYFRPGNNATRGQAAKIVANAFYMDCSH